MMNAKRLFNRELSAPKPIQILGIAGACVATALTTRLPVLRATEGDATVHAVELISMAHAQARTLSLRYGRVSELHIDPKGGRVWVEIDTTADGKWSPVVVREVEPPAVSLEGEATILCFGPKGQPTAGGGCDAAPGSITVRTMTGEQTLVFDAQGQLLTL